MLHKKPLLTVKEDQNFASHPYNFKKLQFLKAEEIEITSPLYISMDAKEYDRIFVILKGLGDVKMDGRKYQLRGSEAENGTVGGRVSLLEVPAGQDLSITGMLKFLSIANR